jgi:hypothetical protein
MHLRPLDIGSRMIDTDIEHSEEHNTDIEVTFHQWWQINMVYLCTHGSYIDKDIFTV